MKSKCRFFILFCSIIFNSVFAINRNSYTKIEYDNIEKYWERGENVEEYLKRATENYSNYVSSTKFDDKFEICEKMQTLGYGSKSGGNILLVVYQKQYNPVTMDDIAIYKSDLESEGYWVKVVTSTNNNDPAAFRDYLFQEWSNNNIDGAFLIGGVPIAWYEMPIFNDDGDTTGWDIFPCDLYYMDVDGKWLDNERSNGIHDDHTGNLEMDIWISRLYTPTMTLHNADESILIERYLKKTHNYREGTLRLKNQGFSYVQKDWAGFLMENEVFKLYDEVTFVNDGINGNVTKNDYVKRIKAATNNKYEWMYLAAHSSPTDHYFKDGLFNSEEIDDIDVQVLFYLNFNCSAASFREKDCLCSWYVMQEPYGLLSVGSTKGGSMLEQYDYYEPLSWGYTFGEAFKYWGVRHFEIRDWHYGVVCIGDPTLKLSRFMTNPGPKFCYAISPERDAKIDSTTPIFKWTETDSADSYILEIYKGGSLVWFSNYISDTLLQIPENKLQLGCSYKWRAKAYSGDECIDFTQYRKFAIRDTNSNYLSDFNIAYNAQDWGNLGIDVSCEGNQIKIAGHEYTKGLGTHANSIIRFDIGGKYKWFTSDIGHDDESNGGNGVSFEVKLDGNTIYMSDKVFMWGTDPEYIKLNVKGGNTLELLVHGGGNIDFDHADWADARLWTDDVGIDDNIVSVSLPEEIQLLGNYPNPFNCKTTISFVATSNLPISLIIYNALGREVKTVIDRKKQNGIHTISWDGKDNFGNVVTSGLYFCRITNGRVCKSSKILFLK